MYNPSVCQVIKDNLEIKKYQSFPYYIYKINDLINIDSSIREYYKNYLIDYNSEKYLLFYHKFDCDFISDDAFGNNVFINYKTIEPYLTTVQKQIINDTEIQKSQLLFLKD